MTIRAVIFDIGGVLEYTPDLHVEERWETRLGLRPGEIEVRLGDIWTAGRLGTISEASVEEAVRERLELSARQCADFMADRWEEYVGTANDKLIEYARGLRGRYRTGILSNSFVGARVREQELYGFEQLVEDIVYSHEVGLRKPDPRIYALTCRRLDVRPGEAVFLDDKPENVAGAAASGLHAVWFTSNAQAIAEVEALLSGAFDEAGAPTVASTE
jgi:epoxide hydrolase-like predicted phosphatase